MFLGAILGAWVGASKAVTQDPLLLAALVMGFVMMAILLQLQRRYESGLLRVLAWIAIGCLTLAVDYAISTFMGARSGASVGLFDIIIAGWPLSMVLRWGLGRLEAWDKKARASGTDQPLEKAAGGEAQ